MSETFKACDPCTKQCMRRIARGDNNAHVPSFCTFLPADYKSRLRIPRKFVDEYGNQLREHIVLEGPSGQIWLVNRDPEMNLVKGWESFVSDHNLQAGEFLVFNMDNASFFKVHIYGKGGGEKHIPFRINSEALS